MYIWERFWSTHYACWVVDSNDPSQGPQYQLMELYPELGEWKLAWGGASYNLKLDVVTTPPSAARRTAEAKFLEWHLAPGTKPPVEGG